MTLLYAPFLVPLLLAGQRRHRPALRRILLYVALIELGVGLVLTFLVAPTIHFS